jgi:hypothetical protein
MRRSVQSGVLCGLLAATVAMPVAAGGPQRGCAEAGGFRLSTIDAFIPIAIGAGWPAELEDFLEGALQAYDNNDDDSICWRPFQPVQTGAFPPGVFNIVDNVVVQR